jgi:hypothetical protein
MLPGAPKPASAPDIWKDADVRPRYGVWHVARTSAALVTASGARTRPWLDRMLSIVTVNGGRSR